MTSLLILFLSALLSNNQLIIAGIIAGDFIYINFP